jgi:hypothetical protein
VSKTADLLAKLLGSSHDLGGFKVVVFSQEVPTLSIAFKEVKTIPPPMTTSHLSRVPRAR